jgi:hypothetical protein
MCIRAESTTIGMNEMPKSACQKDLPCANERESATCLATSPLHIFCPPPVSIGPTFPMHSKLGRSTL